MATRIYLEASGTPSISPAFGTSVWDTTSAGTRFVASTTKLGQALATGTTITSGPYVNLGQLDRQYTIGPLQAQTIAGTVTGYFVAAASSNSSIWPSLYVRAWTPSTSAFQDFISGPASTTLVTTQKSYLIKSGTITSRTVSTGDYLVIEIGGGGTAGKTFTHTYGDVGTDASKAGSGNVVPWIEFSANISFVPPAVQKYIRLFHFMV